MDKFFRLPASDVPGWVGLAVAVLLIMVVAKKSGIAAKIGA